ncbi:MULTISPECIES: hypothetical protein [Alkalihalophilus]|uniref:Uncharacterized protein n=1 Tax=Alkalihalophilus pseudofirmus (strain ATCC BAA-2126 / JCM 17055 / OF4) TaxID=398511 RepID=D3FUN5_ALKPO|nr:MULTISPECIES: hypothetical protein [Alkalihalophilus]ADC50205.1 hypothetical protein BpOF4_10760 [Alkalihalophilus pseudofirmus OF4]MEC2072404.1 hypothetical protein [Alkalihalophilus marmarensis]
MNVYKAHIVHPHTQIPLIAYFNERDGYVTFEKDEAVLNILYELKNDLEQDKYFQVNLEQASNICLTQYPVEDLSEAVLFLTKLGLSADDVEFKQMILH